MEKPCLVLGRGHISKPFKREVGETVMTDISMPAVVTKEHEPGIERVRPILAIKTTQTEDVREEEPDSGILAPDPIALGHANLEAESARPVIAPRLKTVDEMVAAMNAANKRMGSNFKELCLLCAEAASRTEDGSPEREKLHAKLDFSRSKFSMRCHLISSARHRRAQAASHRARGRARSRQSRSHRQDAGSR